MILAHGLGGRVDLPVPLSLAVAGATTAVLVSFLALVALWRTPRLRPPGGRPLPRLQAVVDRPALRTAVQAVALALALLVTVVAFAGAQRSDRNLAPWVLYVTFWVGLVPASLLLGPVWRYANPLRLLHRLLAGLVGPPSREGVPPSLAYWPAAVGLLVFVWLELVYPDRAEPVVVGVFLVNYAVVQLVAALWFGERWFADGDAFEVYSTLLGRLAPLGRDDGGRLVLRNPLRGVAALPARPGLAAVVVVLLGSTAFDGLSRTPFWQEGPGVQNDTTSGTLGLLFMVGLVALLYLLATELPGRLVPPAGGTVDPDGEVDLGTVDPGRGTDLRAGGDPDPAADEDSPADAGPGWAAAFAGPLVPVAVGYAIAHYFSLLLLDGQATWILASNPLALEGVDLFGTYRRTVDYTVVSTEVIAAVQVGAIVVGHVLGVVLAHDRALETAGGSVARQVPLVVVMVLFTAGGLALLFGV